MNIYASYNCNMHCKFCSLHKMKGDIISLKWIEEQLRKYPILASDINILGGEPSILPIDYQYKLIDICTKAQGEKPYYITNLLHISPAIAKTRPIISYDFNLRPSYKKVLNNMMSLDIPYAMSSILTDNLVENVGVKKFINFIDKMQNIYRVDLLLYRSGLTEYDNTPEHSKLMDFVKQVMYHHKINLTPLSSMKKEIDNSFDNISSRIGLLPGNKFGVRIDYNQKSYTPFDSFEEAILYLDMRRKEIEQSMPCKNCKFLGRCWCVGGYEEGICHGDKKMMEFFEKCLSI